MTGVSEDFTLDRYASILQTARAAGYTFIGFPEAEKRAEENGLLCLLRHDCDNDLVAARTMAELENKTGIRSTYFINLHATLYNPLSRPDTALIREVLGFGHRLGLHFDPVYYGETDPDTYAKPIRRESELLSGLFNCPVEAVSLHQPSQFILKNGFKTDLVNTYDKERLRGYRYISDSNMTWREESPDVLFAEINTRACNCSFIRNGGPRRRCRRPSNGRPCSSTTWTRRKSFSWKAKIPSIPSTR